MAPSGVLGAIFSQAKNVEHIPNSTILVLGAENSGKKTLIRGLQAASKDAFSQGLHQKRNTSADNLGALDFMYVEVRNLSQYDSWTDARAAVWLLDDINYKDMLSLRLENVDLRYTAAYICLDAESPWKMMAELSKWFDLLQEFSQSKMKGMRFAEQDVIRQRLADALDVNLESIVYNLGFPVYVAANKCEDWETFEPNVLEAIVFHLRSVCLPYMATMICVEDKQAYFDLLYGYLMEHLYGFRPAEQIRMQMNDVRWDGFWHIPAGADSLELLNTLQDTNPLCAEDRPFESIVKAPTSDSRLDEQPVVAEDSESFLLRAKDLNPTDVKSFFAGLIDKKRVYRTQLTISSEGLAATDASESIEPSGTGLRGPHSDVAGAARTQPLASMHGRLAVHRKRLLPSHSRASIADTVSKRAANDDSDSGSDLSPSGVTLGTQRSDRLLKLMRQNSEARRAKKMQSNMAATPSVATRQDVDTSPGSATLLSQRRAKPFARRDEAGSIACDVVSKDSMTSLLSPNISVRRTAGGRVAVGDSAAPAKGAYDALMDAALTRVKQEAGEDDLSIVATLTDNDDAKSRKSGISKFTSVSKMSKSQPLGRAGSTRLAQSGATQLKNALSVESTAKYFRRSSPAVVKDDSDEQDSQPAGPPPHTQWYREQEEDDEGDAFLSPRNKVADRLADELQHIVRKKSKLSQSEKRSIVRNKLLAGMEDDEGSFLSGPRGALNLDANADLRSMASMSPSVEDQRSVDPQDQPDTQQRDDARDRLRHVSTVASANTAEDASHQVSEEPAKVAADTAKEPRKVAAGSAKELKKAAADTVVDPKRATARRVEEPAKVAADTPKKPKKTTADTGVLPVTSSSSKSAERKVEASSGSSSVARATPPTEDPKNVEAKRNIRVDPNSVALATPRTESLKNLDAKRTPGSDPKSVARATPRTEDPKNVDATRTPRVDPNSVARTTPRIEDPKNLDATRTPRMDPRSAAVESPADATASSASTRLKPSGDAAESEPTSTGERSDRIPHAGLAVTRPDKIKTPSTPEGSQSGVREEVRSELTRLKILSKKPASPKPEAAENSPDPLLPGEKAKVLLRTAEDARKELERLRAKANKSASAQRPAAASATAASVPSGSLSARVHSTTTDAPAGAASSISSSTKLLTDARLELERLKAKAQYVKPTTASPDAPKTDKDPKKEKEGTPLTSSDFRAKLEALKRKK